MSTFRYAVFAAILFSSLALLTLKKQQLDSKYEIGTISDLYFRVADRIFFRSDDDLFGFLNQEDGSLQSVYELEEGEEIISSPDVAEVLISKGKTINVLLPKNERYFQSFESKFVAKHPQFSKIIDFIRSYDLNTLILTDKYLMKLPMNFTDLRETRMKEDILIELNNQREQFFSLCEFFNIRTNKLDYYLSSIIRGDNKTEICFRTISKVNQTARCIPIPANDSVVDVVSTARYIYVQFEEYALALTNLLEFVQKIDSRPLQYFKGFLAFSSDHKYFDPATRTIYNTKIIVEHPNDLNSIKTMTVEEKQLIVQSKDQEKSTEIVKISKDPKDNPRNVWSYTKDTKTNLFRLYVEFESGRLACFEVDGEKHQYKQIWEFKTVQAEKEAIGQIEAKDIEDAQDQQGNGADINQAEAGKP